MKSDFQTELKSILNSRPKLTREQQRAEYSMVGGILLGVVLTLAVQHFFFKPEEPKCEPQQRLVAREVEKSLELFKPSGK